MVVQRITTQTTTKVVRRTATRRAQRIATRRMRRMGDEMSAASARATSNYRQQLQRIYQNTRVDAEAIFAEKGEQFTDEDEEEIKEGDEKDTGFPIFMFAFALIKDIAVDTMDFTLLLIIFTKLINLIAFIILLVWFFGKMKGRWWKKGMVKYFWKRYIGAILIESVPFISVIPATTILVYMAWRREDKLVKMFNEALEAYHRSGLLRHLK